MSTELPAAADLLATTRRALLETIIPALDGPARFQALMAANAIAIALRETPEALSAIATAKAALGDIPTLITAIRAGHHDTNPTPAAALRTYAEARCRISAPKALAL
jgi:acetoacetate decarboxylase